MAYPVTGTAYAFGCLKAYDHIDTVKYGFNFLLHLPHLGRTVECSADGREAIELSELLDRKGLEISIEGDEVYSDEPYNQWRMSDCRIDPRVRELRAQGIDTWVYE